ncbi:MAG: O-antigen ligase family protein [Clostridia bacterium]|nr:O-antigen ligase family protein [Clostridia bacterium]
MKKTSEKTGNLYRTSLLSALISFCKTLFEELAAGSAFVHWLSFDRDEVEEGRVGVFQGFYRRRIAKPVAVFRLWFMRTTESSGIFNIGRRIWHTFLTMPIRALGVCGTVFGLTSATVAFINDSMENTVVNTDMRLVISAGVLVSFFFLLFSKRSVSYVLTHSTLAKALLFKGLGMRRERFEAEEEGPSAAGPVAMGFLGFSLGLLSYFFPLIYVFIGVVLLTGLLLFFHAPEAGVLATLFCLPFLPNGLLVALVLLTDFCFLFKLVRGKRVLFFERMDVPVLLFGALVLISGTVTAAGFAAWGKTVIVLTMVSFYFPLANLLRTEEGLRRVVTVLLASLTVAACYGLLQFVTGSAVQSAAWVDEAQGAIGNRIYSTLGNPNVFGLYLSMLFPFALLFLFRCRQVRTVVIALGVCGVAGLALILTWSRGAWLGALAGALLFLLLYSKQSRIVLVALLCIAPFSVFFLPDTILMRLQTLGNVTADSSLTYRFSIWNGTGSLLRDFWLSGIGLGSDVFLRVYPKYAYSGAAYALHSHSFYLQLLVEHGIVGAFSFLLLMAFAVKRVFLTHKNSLSPWVKAVSVTAGCALLPMLIFGVNDCSWYNHKMLLLGWIVFAVINAAYRQMRVRRRVFDD